MNKKKISSKIVITLMLVILLFNFIFPVKVHAGLFEKIAKEIQAAPAKIFWWMEQGILTTLNNMFTNEANNAHESNTIGGTRLEIKLTPETIIKGRFIIFDANIFKEITNNPQRPYLDYEADGEVVSGKTALRKNVAGWYVALRNFSIVALLSVLVYVGIRMVLSTLAQDKAKYKTMFKDWLVAICLVVFMHFFMIAILQITTMITDALGGGQNSDLIGNLSEDINGILDSGWDGGYRHNGMDLGDAYAKIFVVGGVIVYTIIFAIKYLKREFTIIFLSIIGPAACITYPIDKIGDGKAQAYNRWFTEYLYQVIIQPFHLILYIVLIGTAADLANHNILYALVCFAVMGPAEKFIKEMFGFKDKLGSPLGNLMKAGMARDLVSKATSKLMSGKGGHIGSGGNKENLDHNSVPQTPTTKEIDQGALGGADNDTVGEMAGDAAAIKTLDSGNGERESNGGSAADQMSDAQEQQNIAGQMREQVDDGIENNDSRNVDAVESNNQDGRLSRVGGFIKSGVRHPFKTFDNTRIGKMHSQRMLKKYGTTSRKRRWLKRAPKIVKGTLKGTGKLAKMAAIAGATTIGAGVALATGNGAEAMAIMTGGAAAIASNAGREGKRIIKGAAHSIKGTASDYFKNDAIPGIPDFANSRAGQMLGLDKEEREFKQFEKNPDEQDGAILNFRKNHGRDPNNSELHQEMRDRFTLSQYKLNSDQINKAVGEYQALREANIKEANELEDEDEKQEALKSATKRAADQAAFQAQLADKYKGKFDDPKKMQNAINNVTQQFKEAGVGNEALARGNAIKYLQGAAKMNKETMTLPGGKETVRAEVPRVSRELGIESNDDFNDVQIKRMNELTVQLIDMNYTPDEIRVIASGIDNSSPRTVEVLDNYEAKIEFIGRQQKSARTRIADSQGIEPKEVSNIDVKIEAKKGMQLVDKRNIDEKDVDSVRKIEGKLENKTIGKTDKRSQNEVAWEKAQEIKGKSKEEINNIETRLVGELTAGGSSEEQAKKDAGNVMKQAKKLSGFLKE